MRIYTNLFNKLVTPENLFSAWEDFRRDKKKKVDVLIFEKNLEQEIFSIHRELTSDTYKHSGYTSFYLSDPKRRHIHKALVRDRVLHHAIMGILYPLYDKTFIHNSFSCRVGKGTHKGVDALRSMLYKASKNNTRNVYILKCDIEKFFDSISHEILLDALHSRIKDQKLMDLLTEVIGSFSSYKSNLFGLCGVPIGNLTSQLFANVYMDIFDQFMKHELKVKYYARYTDDFVIVSENKEYLIDLLPKIQLFLNEKLKLQTHPKKIILTKFALGIDYLGYVLFPHFTLVRKLTQKCAFRKINEKISLCKQQEISKDKVHATLMSYLGVLSHADTYKVSNKLKNDYFFNMSNID
ncbi:MAG: group II intron reverse transcriptase domain-containing protein [Candidatus Pacebacteria bacterium]|nr:group II intron reverse transcriptase domain-containing protein [Candidatus Paceibacterota bacterium]MBP9867091.1 group II intron reverse transcriptase domain-containing protein [Candidatus Paceibacterota bacterium]